jgi:hypothetical protein
MGGREESEDHDGTRPRRPGKRSKVAVVAATCASLDLPGTGEREATAIVPGQITSSRNSRGPVSQGDRPRPELMAIHELEPDALAQTGEQRRPVPGKDRLHKELVLVD